MYICAESVCEISFIFFVPCCLYFLRYQQEEQSVARHAPARKDCFLALFGKSKDNKSSQSEYDETFPDWLHIVQRTKPKNEHKIYLLFTTTMGSHGGCPHFLDE